MKDTLAGIAYSKFDRTDLIFRFDKQEMYNKGGAEDVEVAD
jgi:hypothetical protein